MKKIILVLSTATLLAGCGVQPSPYAAPNTRTAMQQTVRDAKLERALIEAAGKGQTAKVLEMAGGVE